MVETAPLTRRPDTQLPRALDLAVFALRAIEHGFGGDFNVVRPAEPLLLRTFLRTWGEVTDRRSPVVWIAPDFLLEHGVRPFDDIPNWIPADDPEPGFYRIGNHGARSHGLTFRALATTLRDGIAELERYGLEPPTSGLSRERETELIAAWRRASG